MIKIPVVLASDENYTLFMFVTILSAVKNKSPNTYYDFYLLVPSNYSEKRKKLFYKFNSKDVHITFICMDNSFQNLRMNINYITYPTYYRLKMADLLPEFDKVLYLDTDVIVLEGLEDFYNINLGSNYIGGVKAAECIMQCKNNSRYYSSIGLDDTSQYINAGVTLWNLKKIREENITSKLIELSQKNFGGMDQDVINVTFYNKILCLDFRYNVMTKYITGDKIKKEQLYNIYGREAYEEGLKHPYVIHYADAKKPWINLFTPFAVKWWKYMLMRPSLNLLPMYVRILRSYVKLFLRFIKYARM